MSMPGAAGAPGQQAWNPVSKKGWVRAEPDLRIWVPCPREFPAGMNRASWSREAAALHWEAAGLQRPERAVQALAAMLSFIHQDSYRKLLCQQIWIYLRDVTQLPLPVFVGIWEARGASEGQLMMLSGASDPDAVRAPVVEEFSTVRLGSGVRALRTRQLDDGSLYGVLGYAFRAAEFETDLQVWASTPDVSRLVAVTGDIDELVRSMSVFSQEELPR